MQKKQHTQQVFPIIKESVNTMVNFIKPTFGPTQNKIMIANEIGSIVLDDGVKLSQEFGVEDKQRNAIMNFIKSVSKKTNDLVGDGTTGSLILLQAIINEIPDFFDSLEIVKELKVGLAEAKKHLEERAKKITTQDELKRVAEISCNDEAIARMISEMIFKIGLEGSLFIEEGKELETKYKIIEGLQFARGFVSPYMATDDKTGEAILNTPKVLLIDKRVGASEMMPFFQKLVREENKTVLLMAEDFDAELISLIITNNLKGVFNVVAVKAPGFATRAEELKDISFLTNTEVFNDVNKLDGIEYEKLGNAQKVVVTANMCTIISEGSDIQKRIEQLKNVKTDSEFDQTKIKERIARLSSGVAVITVGGLTEEEMIAMREKVEDAVNATKVAYKSGVVPGAGQELAKIMTSSKILNAALKVPATVLRENVGNDFKIADDVYDPSEVLIAEVQSAVSIASLLVSTKGLYVSYYEDKKDDQ